MASLINGIKSVLPARAFRPLRATGTALLTPLRFSRSTGHWRSSFANKAVDRNGEPIPWYTYSAIDFLLARDFAGKSVLEFGGGQSTLFWSARAASVLTVEEDLGWFQKLKTMVPQNVELRHVPVDRASRTLEPIGSILEARGKVFDIIVVDGHLRRELTALAFEYLAPRGAIVLDNAEGYGFHEETKWRDCRRIDFYGFTPGVWRQHCTSLVYVGDCFMLDPTIPIVNLQDN